MFCKGSGGWLGDWEPTGSTALDQQSQLACQECLGLAVGLGFQMWKQFKFCFHSPQLCASEVHIPDVKSRPVTLFGG